MTKQSNFAVAFYVLLSLVIINLTSCKNQQPFLHNANNLTISEGFKNPIGFYNASPTFSWNLPVTSDVKEQSAYQIVVASNPDLLPNNADLWDSKKQVSEQSTFIAYAGKNLNSRQKVYWQVKYWNQDDVESNWSDVNHFELGLLKNSDWQAKWIGLDTKKEKVLGSQNNIIHRPQYLRKGFELSSEVALARLYITAKGVFDVAINGKDVSDDVMPPGYTPYKKRIETITYDVTNLIESGQNTIGIEIASGWHSGRLGWMKSFWSDTESPKILCQLELIMKDGSKNIIMSDESWKGTTNGPIRLSEIYDGETYDANIEMPNWTTNNFNDNNWIPVSAFDIDNSISLEPKRHNTVKTKIELPAKEIIKRDDAVIFDFQQNMVGVPLLKVPMKKGQTLKIRFAEKLSPDGSFYTDNYRSAQSTNYYTASKDGVIEWKPKFTFHGFQYVELCGFDSTKEPSKDWVTGLVQYSDFEENGTFTSSHEKLNQLQSNIVWGLRGNFFDIPTDCPQRDERMGWTGDAQVFGPTSMFNANVHNFWASWLQSVRESQYDNGGIPWVVPDVLYNNKVSAGWGDVCVIIPWKIYYRTGDKKILEENYETMKGWVAYHETSSKDLISSMDGFADWLQPLPANGDNKGDTSHSLIGTAFFAHSAKLTAKTAGVLGKIEEQKQYDALYKKIAEAFDKKFFDEQGKIKDVTETQTSYLLALAFGLLPDHKLEQAKTNLLAKIKEADNHLRTGFLGTPLLSEVLDAKGEIDLMYTLLFNETYPSWFYSINQGATTIWERWNSYSKEEGFNPMNMNSLNHYAYGAIGEWMYERIGGIAPLEAGYKKIRIAPQPRNPLKSADATYNTPYGKVSSSWKTENNQFNLDVVVPPNTTAKIIVPAAANSDLKLNGETFKDHENVKLIVKTENGFELLVQPGNYTFISKF
ncbi:family 78 glycoside hydrolase catalytic domain [Siansivirga zeaxanthinifaciens]|uniref:alpha-L-rhamnosidase n=1 Tax=Siansivirga zeaxanthinifaciens CC-SAMT-1 TaxID=1454006 RepID=A0A0C5WNK2_9FLAO|nr:family 78 glycoside hydrolase catalytic domain [Siansivirga zeaxanthinifaciens]AJR04480.1 rhamnosidase [Siansivirga zeaxanthinifaciens CC-SAMT-1]